MLELQQVSHLLPIAYRTVILTTRTPNHYRFLKFLVIPILKDFIIYKINLNFAISLIEYCQMAARFMQAIEEIYFILANMTIFTGIILVQKVMATIKPMFLDFMMMKEDG